MAIEIERKFLVANDGWRKNAAPSMLLQQAYLCVDGNVSVRVRTAPGGHAYLTIKSAVAGSVRGEFEYAIPAGDADELTALRTGGLITKTRHVVLDGRNRWEVDVFSGDNDGLVIAEIELGALDQHFDRPTWLGTEVTGDIKYYNASLAKHPFNKWTANRD